MLGTKKGRYAELGRCGKPKVDADFHTKSKGSRSIVNVG